MPENDDQGQGHDGEGLAELRTAADEGRKAKRELAFVKAGIDTDTPLGAMFATAYTGELNKDAITQEWERINPAPAAPTSEPTTSPMPEPDQSALEAEEAQRAMQDRARRGIASAPAEAPAEQTVDELKTAYQQQQADLRAGLSREKAGRHVLETIIGSAAAGDQRFIWDGSWTDQELQDGRVSRA